ncbi:acyltransferase family protein [Sphingobacterium faecium]
MRNLSIDWLKFFLAICVIFLHLDIFRTRIPELGFILCNGLFRTAVPIFLIITGYYFVNVNNIQKLKTWIARIGVLYLIWMLIYSPIWLKSSSNILFTVMTGYHHLWYLVSSIFAGIILFVCRNLSFPKLFISAVSLFIIGSTIQFIGKLHILNHNVDLIFNELSSYRNFLFLCFPFLTIGFLINKFNVEKYFKPQFYLIILSILLLIFESYLYFKYVDPNEGFDFLFSLIATCPLVFLYVKNLKIQGSSKNIATIATGIYLVHPYIIELSQYLTRQEVGYHFGQAGVLCLTALTTALLVLLNKKIKFLL